MNYNDEENRRIHNSDKAARRAPSNESSIPSYKQSRRPSNPPTRSSSDVSTNTASNTSDRASDISDRFTNTSNRLPNDVSNTSQSSRKPASSSVNASRTRKPSKQDAQSQRSYWAQARNERLSERKSSAPVSSTPTSQQSQHAYQSRTVFNANEELQHHIEDGIASRHELESSRRYNRKHDSSSSATTNAEPTSSSREPRTAKQTSQAVSQRQPLESYPYAEPHNHNPQRYPSQSGPYGESSYAYQDSGQGSGFRFIVVGVIILVVIILVCAFAIRSCQGGDESTETDTADTNTNTDTEALASSEDSQTETSQAETTDFTPSPSALDEVSDSDEIQTFSLSDLETLDLDETQLAAIENAVAAVESSGDVGFVFYDLESGRGIALNPDLDVYGASSFKALYALYLCEDLMEAGTISLTSECPLTYSLDTGVYSPSSYGYYYVRDLIEASIIYSDNGAYECLRCAYDYLGFDDWASELGAEEATDKTFNMYFPTYCARSSAQLWTEMYEYINSDSDTADWLGDLLTQTETSFIRTALESSDAEDLTVRNKAGWISNSGTEYNAVCDAGIIEADGHTYILSVMTSLPDGDSDRELFENLVAALFDARESLNLQS